MQTVLVQASRPGREYQQRFRLPDDVDTEQMVSGMSRDGVLLVQVPRQASPSPERQIPITVQQRAEAVRAGVARYLK